MKGVIRKRTPLCMRYFLILLFSIIMLLAVNSFRKLNKVVKSTVKYRSFSQLPEELHPAYDKLNSFVINEYGLRGTRYNHRKSGADVISIYSSDENKVFGITFRTPPTDSTGIAHVLEHSVLCGSRKFPVKEPFVELMKGSLQNFLNAFTYPDRTCYPIATTNTKDFYNLVNVYLDAVLHPRAITDPQVLQQEGWHYELENRSDPLTIKGVVFNEMKGVYSSPDALMNRASQRALFPLNSYGVDSGGDPKSIPLLNFDQFKAFHKAHYHPSNSRVFFYGNDDPAVRLSLLDEYLRDFDRAEVTSQVNYQPKALDSQGPQKIRVSFPVDPATAAKHMVSVNWLLNDIPLTAKDTLALKVLDSLLLGTTTSVLRKALVESSLGESVVGGGLSDELLQSTFSIGLKGVRQEDVEAVERLIESTLEGLISTGFDDGDVQAAMNTFEFDLREFNTGSYPKGLSVMLGMMSKWIYDQPPEEGIRFAQPLFELQQDIKNGKPVFQDLIRSFLIDNKHKVSVEMVPDGSLQTQQLEAETLALANLKASMSATDIDHIVQTTKELREAQLAVESDEDRASLPKLDLGDIDRKAAEIPSDQVSLAAQGFKDTRMFTHNVETSGILYADLALDYSRIDLEDVPLLPLFARMLMESGTLQLDETALSRRIGTHTGGISVGFHNDLLNAPGTVTNPDEVILFLLLRGKAVADKVPILFELFAEILLNARLGNQKRAIEMLKESKSRKESALLSSGHSFGATRIAARHSFLGHMAEVTGGLTAVREAESLLETAENDWPSLQVRLERMRQAIVQSSGTVINLTADASLLASAGVSVDNFLKALPNNVHQVGKETLISQWKLNPKYLPLQDEAFTIPSQVNYVCLGGPLVAPGQPVKGSDSVVTRYLGNGFLWDQVRVVGGAYGAFASFSEASGRFSYLSYRDPNVLGTINVFDKAPSSLAGPISDAELLQAVIGTVGDLDSPMSPDQKGFAAMAQLLSGERQEDRQLWRDEVLATTAADFHSFGSKLSKLVALPGTLAVFGTQKDLELANDGLSKERTMTVSTALLSKNND